MGAIDPNEIAANIFIETAERLVTGIATAMQNRVRFVCARQDDARRSLSPQQKRDLIDLYQAMLGNPKVKEHAAGMNSAEDFERFVDLCSGIPGDPDDEHMICFAEYKGRAVSFIYGEIRKPAKLFGLWYLVGAGNIRYADRVGQMPLPDNIETAQFTRALVLKLLSEIRRDKSVECMIFEVDAESLKDARGSERSRLKLFGKVEELIESNVRGGVAEWFPQAHSATPKAYTTAFDYVMPSPSEATLPACRACSALSRSSPSFSANSPPAVSAPSLSSRLFEASTQCTQIRTPGTILCV